VANGYLFVLALISSTATIKFCLQKYLIVLCRNQTAQNSIFLIGAVTIFMFFIYKYVYFFSLSFQERVVSVVGEPVKKRFSRCSREPAGNEVSWEAEESPMLSRYRGTTGQDTAELKGLACAVVICKVWRLAMAL
jgi:hypothetical protein